MPGRVLVDPDPGPEFSDGGIALPDSARRFAGYRRGRVLAVGAATEEYRDLPRVGELVHYQRNTAPPRCDYGVQRGDERLVMLHLDQVLVVEIVDREDSGG